MTPITNNILINKMGGRVGMGEYHALIWVLSTKRYCAEIQSPPNVPAMYVLTYVLMVHFPLGRLFECNKIRGVSVTGRGWCKYFDRIPNPLVSKIGDTGYMGFVEKSAKLLTFHFLAAQIRSRILPW
jgi:hypothetical protein